MVHRRVRRPSHLCFQFLRWRQDLRRQAPGTADPTHPYLTADGEKLGLVFQARDGKAKAGWGKMGVYYREMYPDNSASELARVAEGKGNLSYPTVALGQSGRIFIGWTETSEGQAKAFLLRGRANLRKGATD